MGKPEGVCQGRVEYVRLARGQGFGNAQRIPDNDYIRILNSQALETGHQKGSSRIVRGSLNPQMGCDEKFVRMCSIASSRMASSSGSCHWLSVRISGLSHLRPKRLSTRWLRSTNFDPPNSPEDYRIAGQRNRHPCRYLTT